jgi:hypothetical protein
MKVVKSVLLFCVSLLFAIELITLTLITITDVSIATPCSSSTDSSDMKRQRTTTLTVPVEELENYTPIVWSTREQCYEVYDHYDRQGLKKALQGMTPVELLTATEDEQYATHRISGREGGGACGGGAELTEPIKMNIIGTVKFHINSEKKIFRLECNNSSVF